MQQLSPELIKLLQGSNSGYAPGFIEQDGRHYQRIMHGSSGGEGGDGGLLNGYQSYDPAHAAMGEDGKAAAAAGATVSNFDKGGAYMGERAWGVDDWQKNLAMALAAAGGMYFGAGALGANGTGTATGLAGDAMMPGALGANGSAGLASGALTPYGGVLPGLEAYVLPAAAAGGAAGGAAGAGGATGAGGAASTGGLLSSLGGTNGLGMAATALGALGGSKGNEQSQTSQNKMDPRMDEYIYGGNGQHGLLGITRGLLNQGISPEAQARTAQLRAASQGLLSAPVRGNGFNMFTGR